MIPGLRSCRQCPICHNQNLPVPGEGPVLAEVMLIGEAPGPSEARQGRPFVGPSGKLLNETLAAYSIHRDELYVTNAVKGFPTKNGAIRQPSTQEILACKPWLEMEIALINPKLIVAVGNNALYALFGSGAKCEYQVPTGELNKKGEPKTKAITISQARRRTDLEYVVAEGTYTPTSYGPVEAVEPWVIPVLAILHPAAALRGGSAMPKFKVDVRRIAVHLGRVGGDAGIVDYRQATQDNIPDLHNTRVAIDTEFVTDKMAKVYEQQAREGTLPGHYHGVPPKAGDLFCLTFSVVPRTGFIVFRSQPDFDSILEYVLRNASVIVMHAAQADVPRIQQHRKQDIRDFPWHKVRDTMVAYYNLGYKGLSLKALAESKLNRTVILLDEILEDGQTFDDLEVEDITEYGCQDADLTIELDDVGHRELQLTAI